MSTPPHRVAIIADGNGRWAQARGLPPSVGHRAGADTLKARICDAIDYGIEELTIYSFSTENWKRPAHEVLSLIAMLTERISTETPGLNRNGVRIRFIGRQTGTPQAMLEQMRRAEALTARNKRLSLFLAINYGARAEILDAAARFTGSTEEEFRRCLYAPDMHDPQLIIRTGSERRLSNYLLWQAAFSELVFRDELWPDFTRQAFLASLAEYTTPTPHSHEQVPVITASRLPIQPQTSKYDRSERFDSVAPRQSASSAESTTLASTTTNPPA
ncbi:MAG TPA: polyprenyl diphosphate synthase [Solirubrobacteraceae bacterium]|nr:polyprenyl diphosphate synthase [Solirubrobacteraceae bacterium]